MQIRPVAPNARLRRRSFARNVALGAVAFALGCATSSVSTERDDSYDASVAQTYAWVTEDHILIQFGQDQPNVRTQENEVLVRAAMDRELGARGLTKVDKAEADLLVAFSVGTRMRYRVEGGDKTSLLTDGPSEKQTKGTLNIYVLDRASNTEVWHGWTSKWLDKRNSAESVIGASVKKVLDVYPN